MRHRSCVFAKVTASVAALGFGFSASALERYPTKANPRVRRSVPSDWTPTRPRPSLIGYRSKPAAGDEANSGRRDRRPAA